MNALTKAAAVVGVALLLVVALGTAAWAVAYDEAVEDPVPAVMGARAALQNDFAGPGFGPRTAGRHGGGFMGRGLHDEQSREQLDELREQRREILEEQREERLDELAAKMSEQDRQRFDELREQAAVRRDALEEARNDLRETTTELQDLMRQYLPSDGGGAR